MPRYASDPALPDGGLNSLGGFGMRQPWRQGSILPAANSRPGIRPVQAPNFAKADAGGIQQAAQQAMKQAQHPLTAVEVLERALARMDKAAGNEPARTHALAGATHTDVGNKQAVDARDNTPKVVMESRTGTPREKKAQYNATRDKQAQHTHNALQETMRGAQAIPPVKTLPTAWMLTKRGMQAPNVLAPPVPGPAQAQMQGMQPPTPGTPPAMMPGAPPPGQTPPMPPAPMPPGQMPPMPAPGGAPMPGAAPPPGAPVPGGDPTQGQMPPGQPGMPPPGQQPGAQRVQMPDLVGSLADDKSMAAGGNDEITSQLHGRGDKMADDVLLALERGLARMKTAVESSVRALDGRFSHSELSGPRPPRGVKVKLPTSASAKKPLLKKAISARGVAQLMDKATRSVRMPSPAWLSSVNHTPATWARLSPEAQRSLYQQRVDQFVGKTQGWVPDAAARAQTETHRLMGRYPLPPGAFAGNAASGAELGQLNRAVGGNLKRIGVNNAAVSPHFSHATGAVEGGTNVPTLLHELGHAGSVNTHFGRIHGAAQAAGVPLMASNGSGMNRRLLQLAEEGANRHTLQHYDRLRGTFVGAHMPPKPELKNMFAQQQEGYRLGELQHSLIGLKTTPLAEHSPMTRNFMGNYRNLFKQGLAKAAAHRKTAQPTQAQLEQHVGPLLGRHDTPADEVIRPAFGPPVIQDMNTLPKGMQSPGADYAPMRSLHYSPWRPEHNIGGMAVGGLLGTGMGGSEGARIAGNAAARRGPVQPHVSAAAGRRGTRWGRGIGGLLGGLAGFALPSMLSGTLGNTAPTRAPAWDVPAGAPQQAPTLLPTINKTAAQDNAAPQRSSTGDSAGLTYASHADDYAQGPAAWNIDRFSRKGGQAYGKKDPRVQHTQVKSSGWLDKLAAYAGMPEAGAAKCAFVLPALTGLGSGLGYMAGGEQGAALGGGIGAGAAMGTYLPYVGALLSPRLRGRIGARMGQQRTLARWHEAARLGGAKASPLKQYAKVPAAGMGAMLKDPLGASLTGAGMVGGGALGGFGASQAMKQGMDKQAGGWQQAGNFVKGLFGAGMKHGPNPSPALNAGYNAVRGANLAPTAGGAVMGAFYPHDLAGGDAGWGGTFGGALAGAAAFNPRLRRLAGRGTGAIPMNATRTGIMGGFGGSMLDAGLSPVHDTGGYFGRTGARAGTMLGGVAGGARAVGGAIGPAKPGTWGGATKSVARHMDRTINAVGRTVNDFGNAAMHPIQWALSTPWRLGGGAVPQMLQTGAKPGLVTGLGRMAGIAGIGGGAVGMGYNALRSGVDETVQNAMGSSYEGLKEQAKYDLQNALGMGHDGVVRNTLARIDPMIAAMGIDPNSLHPAQKAMLLGGGATAAGGFATGHPLVGLAGMGAAGLGGMGAQNTQRQPNGNPFAPQHGDPRNEVEHQRQLTGEGWQ